MLDRPLTVGFFWGLFSGDWATSLGVCLFFELYWLDLFPAGTIIPPNAIASALATLTVMHMYSLTGPAEAAVIMLAALPLGRIFARIERYHRQYENDAYNRLVVWAKHPERGNGPRALTRRSMLVMLPVSGAAFALATILLLAMAHVVLPPLSAVLAPLPLKWPHLWVVASIGAVLSLRHKPAYVLLACGVVLAIVTRLVV